jgi:hypothetical protein
MIISAASTYLVDSVLVSSVSSQPIGSEAFTISGAGPNIQRADLQASKRALDAFKACLANDLIWIEDFCDDQVVISRDLYEVLEAFAQVRRQDIGENQ